MQSSPMPAATQIKEHWYVVQCVTGREDKVKADLDRRVQSMGLEDRILETLVPKEKAVVMKDGKRRTVDQKLFGGYLMVKMVLDEETWTCVRSAIGVLAFVGGDTPQPLSPDEVAKIEGRRAAEQASIKMDIVAGMSVRIVDGPFSDFMGQVAEVDGERGKVKVMVHMFGRETPVDLDIMQVRKLD